MKLFSAKPHPYTHPQKKALEIIKQEKGTPDQFKAMLLKNGSKQAELDYMGWDEAFTEKSITKADIQKWIDQNKVEVEEVSRGRVDKKYKTLSDQEENWQWELESTQTSWDAWNKEAAEDGEMPQSRKDQIKDWEQDFGSYENLVNNIIPSFKNYTKYSQWQLPGGSNYRVLAYDAGEGFSKQWLYRIW